MASPWKAGQGSAALPARRALDVFALHRRLRRPGRDRSPDSAFDHYLQEHIFDPLGMKDTAFVGGAGQADRFSRQLSARAPTRPCKLIDDPARQRLPQAADLLLRRRRLTGTTEDYLRFCEMLRRGGELDGARILGPRTIELMHRNHLKDGKDLTQMAIGGFSETANEGVGFGLGFATTLGHGEVRHHRWPATTTGAARPRPSSGSIAKEDLVVVFMTQLMPSGTFNFRGQLKSIIYSSIVD